MNWAAIIGINHYQHLQGLDYCVADAIAFFALMTHPQIGRFQTKHVSLFIDGSEDEISRTVEIVTKYLHSALHVDVPGTFAGDVLIRRRRSNTSADMAYEIKRCSDNVDSNGFLLTYISSHGQIWDGRLFSVGSSSRSDSPTQSLDIEKDVITVMNAANCSERLLILDLCHAGQLINQVSNSLSQLDQKASIQKTLAILSANRSKEASFEDWEKQHGVFTYYLIEILSTAATNRSTGFITLPVAYEYVSNKVKEWNAKYDPPSAQFPIILPKEPPDIVLSGSRPETFGQWKVERQIGYGGYARIWRVISPDGKHGALKEFHGRFLPEDLQTARRRFIRGMEEQSKYNHQNILPIIDQKPERDYFVMPLVVPGDLEAYLRTRPFAFNEKGFRQRIQLLLQLAQAVKYLHFTVGAVHRDINYKNVLVDTERDELKLYLTDFDIAHFKLRTPITEPQQHQDWRQYLSQHYRKAAEDDSRNVLPHLEQIDIVAIGALILYMFTQEIPAPSFLDEGFANLRARALEQAWCSEAEVDLCLR